MKKVRFGGGKSRLFASLLGVTLLSAVPVFAQDTVADGRRVSLEYTLSLEDQSVFDTNVGRAPLVYTHGAQQLVPGLERQLTGLKVGDTKNVEVQPEDAYGLVDPKRFQEVPKENVPDRARGVGEKLQGRGPDGSPIYAQVKEVKKDTVIVDLNHPLAGKKLFFAIKVLKVEKAVPQKVEIPDSAAESQR